ncbi:hypothetical protein E2C01_000434 [Portunus trituberculatus]|uniref:Secreted protein n=1 Tax=Portunus trituberculatus TaxID=210409 RepID=A0A5B7CHF2_PORTR|nr:hypothetical protein [Portunus trituberculatus]
MAVMAWILLVLVVEAVVEVVVVVVVTALLPSRPRPGHVMWEESYRTNKSRFGIRFGKLYRKDRRSSIYRDVVTVAYGRLIN